MSGQVSSGLLGGRLKIYTQSGTKADLFGICIQNFHFLAFFIRIYGVIMKQP